MPRDDFASHRVTQHDGKVTIHDLELFVGFDPSIDDKDDEKLRKYDEDKIAQVVARTQAHMGKGQFPKLILGHNPDEDDGTVRPAIGDILTVRSGTIGGVPGILGDVEMSTGVFESTFQSNAFPRRSAEIWGDGYMSEVALLGSQTPARPIPDTKFMKDGLTRESFARHLPVVQFAQPVSSMSDPGPTNVSPPRSTTMADDDKHDDLDQLKAKLKAAEDERDEAKNKLAKFMEDDDDDKDKNARKGKPSKSSVRAVERERDSFARQLEEQKVQTAELRKDWLSERYDRELDDMAHRGYRIGDATKRRALLDEIVDAADPTDSLDTAKQACDAKVTFFKSIITKDPHGLRIDQAHARITLPGDEQEKYDREKAAGERARDRCVMEGTSDPEKYQAYVEEELQKTG